MSDSDSMSYDFSQRYNVNNILPQQEVDPENDTLYRRRWFKLSVVMLVVAVVFNVVVGVRLHTGISYIERQIREEQRVIDQTTSSYKA